MDNLYESIYRYFITLSNRGYVKQVEVNKLMLYILISELLNNNFGWCVPEEDYTIMNKALYCLYGSTCLIPYPDYYSSVNNSGKQGKMYGLSYRSESCRQKLASLEDQVSQILNKEVLIPTNGEVIEDFDL